VHRLIRNCTEPLNQKRDKIVNHFYLYSDTYCTPFS
jgi:hypothetical protein